jgi:hypothetical protein
MVIAVALTIGARKSASGRRFAAIGISAIAGAIIFEFATFFATAAIIVEQSWGAWIVACAMLIGIASCFPFQPAVGHRGN